jgi:hypothetical protein
MVENTKKLQMHSTDTDNTRSPKFMGSGIYMIHQFQPCNLVIGDTCFDVDFGELIWDGIDWITNKK